VTDKTTSGQNVLEGAVTIFEKVKHKIDGLIDCSVKDFELLNSNFKKYFNNLQKVSETSNSFINFVLDANQHRALIELSNPDIFDKEKFYKRLSAYTEQLKQVHKNFNYYLLIISNLKQDLSTIRLLFTNLKFDPLISADYKKINALLDSIGNCYEKQEAQISKICSSLNETITFTDNGLFNSIELFGNQIDKIREAFKHLLHLSYSAKQQKQKLEQLDKKKATSTSAIITNLQFQDILRQKIEHVQEAHNEITFSLKNTHHEGELLNDDELIKIRDINTLQSAQLIHANQEYQRAVETIVLKINELNSLLNNYLNIWNHFCKPESGKFIFIKSKLTEKTMLINSQNFSLNQLYDKFTNLNKDLEDFLNDSILLINKKENLCFEISALNEILDSTEKVQVKGKEYNPIEQIRGEIIKLEYGFKKLSNSLNTYNPDNKNVISFPQIDIKPEIELIKNFSSQITNFYNLYLNEQIEHISASINIDSSANFSIEQVSYYKTFEKEVKEIIDLLDNLLTIININKKEIDNDRLEHLKKLYTMESEREVHNIVIGKGAEKKSASKGKKDNEVEFF
jgi:hypothetical protein